MPIGSKTCKSCGESCGPRRTHCPACGESFRIEERKAEKAAIEAEKYEEKTARKVFRLPDGLEPPERFTVICAAAGKCPITMKYEGEFPDDETVTTWALDVREHMLKKGEYLTNEALLRWAGYEINDRLRFSPVGDEMKYIGLLINGLPDIVTSEVAA